MSFKNWMAMATTVAANLTFAASAGAVTAPYSEDFESESTCATQCASVCTLSASGWLNDVADGRDWLVDVAGTTSGNTGPSLDFNPGTNTGKYLYVETSSPCSTQTGESNLISPVLELTGTTLPIANFWYHQFGDDIGELHVDVLDSAQAVIALDVIPAIVGGNVDQWVKTANVDLSPYLGMGMVHLRIRSIHSGTGFEGDQAVDNFAFYDNNAPDLAVANVGPNACSLGNAEIVTVDITNNGGADATNVDVSYTLNSGAPVTEMIATIAAGTTVQYAFAATADLSTAGPFTIDVNTVVATEINPIDNAASLNGFNGLAFPPGVFIDDFEGANVPFQWLADGANSDWALGTPAKSVITGAASGTNAWVTNLTADYNTSQNSAVTMACGADFAALMDPVVRLNVWYQSEFSWDGAVVQYTTDSGATWQVVGEIGSGTNWYTDGTINGAPGDQPLGWSGRDGNGSGGYLQASHAVAEVGGLANVKFRIAFGSDTSVVDDGVAFDDFEILSNATLPAVATMAAAPVLGPDLGGVHQGALYATQSIDIFASGPVGFDSLTVTNTGDILDADIIWNIFADDGDGVFGLATDTLVGMQAQTAGQATISLLTPVPYGATTRFHVVAQIAAGAVVGNTLNSEISAATDIVLSGSPALTDNIIYPFTGDTVSVVERVMALPYVDDMSVQSAQIAGRTLTGNVYPTSPANGPITFGNPTANDGVLTFEMGNGALLPVVGTGLLTFDYANGNATSAIQHAFDLSAYTAANDILWFELRHADRGSDNSNFDHVFVSVDGGNAWDASLLKFNYTSQADDTWVIDTLDLSAALTAAGVDYSDQVVIRTQVNETTNTEFAFVDSVKLGLAPRTALDRATIVILDNGSDDIGAVIVGQPQSVSYTITNNGDYDLDISGGVTSINEVNVSNLVVTPATATILAPGASDVVIVSFDTLMGAFAFDLELLAADPHLGDGSYTISVTGMAADPFVDLDVQRPEATSIEDGGTDDQGTIEPAMMTTLTYTIENLGNVDANITGVSIANLDNATATATMPDALLGPNATTTFDVTYQATANGAFSFDLVVASDDPDEAMYTITVTGTADDMVPSDPDAGTVGGADAGTDPGDGNSDSGCGCSTGPGGTSSANWLWFALLGLFLVTRRRRHTS